MKLSNLNGNFFRNSFNPATFLYISLLTIVLCTQYSCRKDESPIRSEKDISPNELLQVAKDWFKDQTLLAKPDVTEGRIDIRKFTPSWEKANFNTGAEGQLTVAIPLSSGVTDYYELNVTVQDETSYGVVKYFKYLPGNIADLKIYGGNGKITSEGIYDFNKKLYIERVNYINKKSPLFRKTMTGGESIELEEVNIEGGGTRPTGCSSCPVFPTLPAGGSGGNTGPAPSGGGGVAGDTPALQAFEVDYKGQMKPGELAIYENMSRIDQVAYLLNAKSAIDLTNHFYPTLSQHNDKADAFRHTYFSAANRYALGLTKAKQLGDAHEEFDGNPVNEKAMDLHNNEVGRSITAPSVIFGGNPYDHFVTEVKAKIGAGELKCINSNGSLVNTSN